MSDLIDQLDEFDRIYPGNGSTREPVHVIYGGAHLFDRDTVNKLSLMAARSFELDVENAVTLAEIFGIDPVIADDLLERIADKLKREAIEDMRIDFEDGYGIRSDEEEDGHAVTAAIETAAAVAASMLPPFFGIRCKAFSRESIQRAKRTLDIYFDTLAKHSDVLPDNFVVTLPKPVIAEQVAELAKSLTAIEQRTGFAKGSIGVEIMVETPQALIGADGRIAIREMAAAADGRCVAAHFGVYDHTAAIGIISRYQTYDHSICDLARGLMQHALAGTGIRISDGATNVMPIGPNRGADLNEVQHSENRAVVRRAWRTHFDNVRRSLENGIYIGWDLHPAQLIARYAAIYSFFFENAAATGERLRRFIDNAARATLLGDVFDDAATGQGLLNFFRRAVTCGAISADEAHRQSGLTIDELLSASFSQILVNRRSQM